MPKQGRSPHTSREQNARNAKENRAFYAAIDQAAAARSRGMLLLAVEALREALALQPGHPQLHFLIGRDLLAAGDLPAAKATFEQCIDVSPTHPGAHNSLGMTTARMGDLSDALVHFKRASELDPKYPLPHYNAAKCQASLQRWQASVQGYRAAIALRPKYPKALANLAVSLSECGQHRQAIHEARRALALAKDDFIALRALAVALTHVSDKEAADKAWRDVLRISQSPKTLHLHRAATGETTEAPPEGYVREEFEGFARSFDAVLAELQYCGPDLVAEALSAVLETGTNDLLVYDLGCGTGACGPMLRPYARELVGIDLSPKMLEIAKTRNCYDSLQCDEVVSVIARATGCELIVAADVLIYLGRLEPLFQAVSTALKPGGIFAFTTESLDDGNYRLEPSGRYSHNSDYVVAAAKAAGLSTASHETKRLRFENGHPVPGGVFVVRRRT